MAHTPFSGCIPDDRLYSPRHDMWVKPIEDTICLIGATRFGVFLAGQIIAFTGKPQGAMVDQGRGMGTVESRKTVQAVHAPISFTLLENNESAEENPRLINEDPHGNGWMARVEALHWAKEKSNLVDAATYREHILKLEPEARFD